MSSDRISSGDTVKHKNKEVEMLVISENKHWITCEYADEEGERIEKIYDQEFLVIVRKRPPIAKQTSLQMRR